MCAVGEVFAGRYELIDPLGEGGAGVVWRAWDRRSEQYVAAKVLRQVDAASLLRFVREQSFRVDHPHVVVPLGWAGEDDRVLFTMPLVRGGSVTTLLGDYGPLPATWVAALVDQLLDALSAIHEAGLVHRDVKPANMLLEPTGLGPPHLLLSDFGIAAPLNMPRMTHTDVVLGTSGYVAPEAFAGADPDARQDLYAAGMSTVEMLTGSRPPKGLVGDAVLATLDPSAPLTRFVAALVQALPEDRPASAAQARELLRSTGLVPGPGEAPATDEPIEIFDQLPAMPPSWRDGVPDGVPRVPPPPVVESVDVPTTTKSVATPTAETTAQPAVPTTAQPIVDAAAEPTVALPVEPPAEPTAGQAEASENSAASRRSWAGLAVPLVAVAVGVGLLVVALIQSR